jgi:hypothetical protein
MRGAQHTIRNADSSSGVTKYNKLESAPNKKLLVMTELSKDSTWEDVFNKYLHMEMKKYDKVFVPTYGKDAELGLIINDGKNKVFPAKELKDVIVLTEDEFNQMKSDFKILLDRLGELD